MFGLFKRKQKGIPATATLNVRLMPVDRGIMFEDPLDEWLKEKRLGSVEGGGCALSEAREIAYCDLELVLKEVTEDVVNLVTEQLERLGAPKGSVLSWEGGTRTFGAREGLAVYLNGADLPDEVYAAHNADDLVAKIESALEGVGSYYGGWNGPTETGLYCYGPSFEAMKQAIQATLTAEPLAQSCRVEQIA